MLTNYFVHVLAIRAGADSFHEQPLGGCEKAIGFKVTLNSGAIQSQAVQDMLHPLKEFVGGEEGFWQDRTAVGGVIQGALK